MRPTPRVGIRTASSRLGTGLDQATSRRTEPRARPPSEPRAAGLPPRPQPGSGLREGAVTAAGPGPGDAGRLTPTFLLGPRRGHDEGHHQVQRSQEAGGRAPRAPAAAGRGLQTGPGGRGGGGGSCCSSSGPLPHPCRPRAAALEIRRGPSRLGGGGAGAVVRALAAAPGARAVLGPGLGLRAWVWVRACV